MSDSIFRSKVLDFIITFCMVVGLSIIFPFANISGSWRDRESRVNHIKNSVWVGALISTVLIVYLGFLIF